MIKRMWVNQPSIHQGYNNLHGTNVLADWHGYLPDLITIWFLSGPVVCQQISRHALSNGWVKETGELPDDYEVN